MPTAYITCPPASADELAATLVEERLAACVNQVRSTSTYRWKGEVVEEAERILLCKTTDRRYDDLAERVHELHPHDVPCIERFDVDDVDGPFAEWIESTLE